jgi:hypothetical protein
MCIFPQVNPLHANTAMPANTHKRAGRSSRCTTTCRREQPPEAVRPIRDEIEQRVEPPARRGCNTRTVNKLYAHVTEMSPIVPTQNPPYCLLRCHFGNSTNARQRQQTRRNTDCKSVGKRLPRFESWTCHRGQRVSGPAATGLSCGPVRSSRSGGVKCGCHRVEVVGKQMPVAVGRQHRCLVPDQALHHFDVRPGTDRQRRTRMPQIVQAHTVTPVDRSGGFGEGVAGLTEGQVPAAARRREHQRVAIATAISFSSSRVRDAGIGTARAVWFFVGSSTRPVLRT